MGGGKGKGKGKKGPAPDDEENCDGVADSESSFTPHLTIGKCEGDWYDRIKNESNLPLKRPAEGVGATIAGKDGEVWGVVVADEDKVWKLESGRIAKKETVGDKWNFASPKAEGVRFQIT